MLWQNGVKLFFHSAIFNTDSSSYVELLCNKKYLANEPGKAVKKKKKKEQQPQHSVIRCN